MITGIKHFKTLFSSIMLICVASFATPTYAANDAMLELMKILRDKGSITQEEYDLLLNAAKGEGEATKKEVEKQVAEATKDVPKISTKGKLELKDKDGNKFRIGGRLQADTTIGLGDVNFEGSEGGNPVTEFRRARMYLSGVFQHDWKFKFQYDFADQSAGATSAANTAGFKDAYIAYTGFKPAAITFGHHKTPLSLEELTSSKYITFIERSQLVNGIVVDTSGGRKYALSATGHFNDMFTLSGAGYVGSANEDTAEDAGHGFVGRLTFSPIHEKTKMVHLGLGLGYDSRSDGGYNIDGEPEIHPGSDILETETGAFKQATTWVAEAAAIHGPWAIQAEYASAELSEGTGLADIDADAWYVYGSYHFTGESRNYKWKKGSYSQTKVKNPLGKGGYGAWEAALRYTSGDFENTGTTVSSDADIITAGLNWYPINNVRFSGNYVSVLDSSPAADTELAGDLDAGSKADDASYFILRGQWYF
jgi:phosphate-selective porin OprO and OprP